MPKIRGTLSKDCNILRTVLGSLDFSGNYRYHIYGQKGVAIIP